MEYVHVHRYLNVQRERERESVWRRGGVILFLYADII